MSNSPSNNNNNNNNNNNLVKEKPLSLFLLNNLPKESSFGLDSKLWIVDKFNGVKNIPPGLHLFTFTASPNFNSTNQTKGIEIKHGLFKFFSNKNKEILIEEWDNLLEELLSDSNDEILLIKRNRNYLTSNNNNNNNNNSNSNNNDKEVVEEIIISEDYLNSIDSKLASYPLYLEEEWLNLSNFITIRTIYKVIGLDARLNSRVDASMGTNQDSIELNEVEIGKKIWGKERVVGAEGEVDQEELGGSSSKEIIKEEVLEFIRIESKRTWPKGSVGSELTKWSKDKSWYLSNIIFNQLGKESQDIQEYLAELQLSFILFVLLHNYSSLTIYKSLFNLLCQSPSILYPINSINNPINSNLIQKFSLPLFKSFLNLFKKQLIFLEDNFFSSELPDLEIFFLDQLSSLQINLIEAGREWELLPPFTLSSSFSTDTTSSSLNSNSKMNNENEIEMEEGPKRIWNLIILEWDEICTISMKKFGWNLESINLGSSRRQTERDMQRGVGGSGRVRDDDEVDLEDLEEGDEAPVIVEL